MIMLVVKFLVAAAIPTAHISMSVLKDYKDKKRAEVKEYVQANVPGEKWDELVWTMVDNGLDETVEITEQLVKEQISDTRFLFRPTAVEMYEVVIGEVRSKVYHLP